MSCVPTERRAQMARTGSRDTLRHDLPRKGRAVVTPPAHDAHSLRSLRANPQKERPWLLPKHARAFDPLDLELIERAYDAAWAELAARAPQRDPAKDEERKLALRKCVDVAVQSGEMDVDALRNRALAHMPEYWFRRSV